MLAIEELSELTTGLSPHYMLIYNIVRGLNTEHAFEFGAGLSTHVILSALKHTDGHLISCSMESRELISNKTSHPIVNNDNWIHYEGYSEKVPSILGDELLLDFALHDGSHSDIVVEKDLLWIKNKIRYNGILLIHDTLHSYCGKKMRTGIERGLVGIKHEKVTLPYGFGLTIICIKDNKHLGITNGLKKRHSPHLTEVL